MAKLRIVFDPSGPAGPTYTMHYVSSPAATPEEHEMQHAKHFAILRDLLQKRGVDIQGVRLEVTRIKCEQVPDVPDPVPVIRTITESH
jgi:hypothetical protein